MSLGDLNDRLDTLTEILAVERQRYDLLQAALEAQGRHLAELLRRTEPRCEDSLEAVEAAQYPAYEGTPWELGGYHRSDCGLDRMHTGPCTPIHTPGDSPQGVSLPSLAEPASLAASPEAGNGDAPQGPTVGDWAASIMGSAAYDLGRVVADLRRARGSLDARKWCAICDGDALPVSVRLKGGGFVCEGCVVLEYPDESAG